MDAFRCNLGGIYRLLRPERQVPDAVFVCDRKAREQNQVAALVKTTFGKDLGVFDAAIRQTD